MRGFESAGNPVFFVAESDHGVIEILLATKKTGFPAELPVWRDWV